MNNLFISHVWNDSNDYDNLVSLLDKEAPNFEYKNYSVPEGDPIHTKSDKELHQKLEQRIARVSCVLVPARVSVTHHKWVRLK